MSDENVIARIDPFGTPGVIPVEAYVVPGSLTNGDVPANSDPELQAIIKLMGGSLPAEVELHALVVEDFVHKSATAKSKKPKKRKSFKKVKVKKVNGQYETDPPQKVGNDQNGDLFLKGQAGNWLMVIATGADIGGDIVVSPAAYYKIV